MEKTLEEMKTAEEVFYSRNPYILDEMAKKTVLMCMEDYAQNSKRPLERELAAVRDFWISFAKQQQNEIDSLRAENEILKKFEVKK